MKAIEILKDIEESKWCGVKPTLSNYNLEDIKKAIKELEELETKDRLAELEALEIQNKSLVKTLEKMNEEMIDLRKENQDLKNSNNELLEGLKSTQKRLEEWLEKCK